MRKAGLAKAYRGAERRFCPLPRHGAPHIRCAPHCAPCCRLYTHAFSSASPTAYACTIAIFRTSAGHPIDHLLTLAHLFTIGTDRRTPRPSRKDQGKYPPYIQFTLHKTNRETQDCISHLASRLGVHPRDLGTAGTKDKRGVTTQLVTLKRYGRTIEEVWDTVNGLHHGRSAGAFNTRGRGRGRGRGGGGAGFLGREGMAPTDRGERGLRIGDLKYVSEALDLGHLSGNRFCIVLRDVRAPPDVISRSLGTLQETGFINFFGMQRFGNSSVPTHAVGLQLLLSNWKEAAKLVLSPRDGDSDDVLSAREAWNTHKDAKKALQLMPKWLVAERCSAFPARSLAELGKKLTEKYLRPITVLEHFDKNNGSDADAHGALTRIPKNLRMMYVHAYQSYLWNSVVSSRIASFGTAGAVAGDLVYANPEPAANDDEKPSREGKITKESVTSNSKVAKVKILTEQDKDKYTIHDVVLPLPGYAVTYPGGELGEMYRRMMAADGLDADDLFRSQKCVLPLFLFSVLLPDELTFFAREFSLSGTYRKILLKPTDLRWSKIAYSDPNQDLVQPDEDALLGFPAPDLAQNDEEGDKLAIKIEFSLGTAAYATMALREVLKGETGNVQQRAMTEKMLDKHSREVAAEEVGLKKADKEGEETR